MAKVLKAEEALRDRTRRVAVLHLADLAEEARRVVLDARKEAAAIIAQAKNEASQLRSAAMSQGYAEGLLQGRDEGYRAGARDAMRRADETASTESAEIMSFARCVLEKLQAEINRFNADAAGRMLEFAIELAEKIVGRVAETDISAARANLAKALELVHGGEIVVKVNPQQLAGLRSHCEQLVATLAVSGNVRIEGDANVGAGGVKIISGRGEVDATIKTQLDNVVTALLGGARAGRCDSNVVLGQYIGGPSGVEAAREQKSV